jgi:uncharacterized membrane protein YeaQ/YmgE (transglycosylase-associated protein family)
MLGSVIVIMVMGFVSGGLARLAVPGPDPMPVWLTVTIGLIGSWGGGAIGAAIWGWDSTTGVSLTGFLVSVLLVVAYRRFVQGRPFSGPEAQKFPERGIGMARFRERQRQFEELTREHKRIRADGDSVADSVAEQIRKLSELHDAGVLTDEEFEAKKAQLQTRL